MVAGKPVRLWLGALVWAGASAVAGTALALAVNAASDLSRDSWPSGLVSLRDHPLRWAAGLTAAVAVVGLLWAWWQTRLELADDSVGADGGTAGPVAATSTANEPVTAVGTAHGGAGVASGMVVGGSAVVNVSINQMAPEPVPTAGRVSVGSVPLLADCFQLRREHQQVLDSEPGAVVLSQVFTGAGGVGKTQLAAQLAHRLWDENDVDVRVWIAATTEDSIVDGYAQAAAKVDQAADDASESARRFIEWLAATDRPWLVILDDVTDPVSLRGWVPRSANGRVVVTTRRSDNALASVGTMVQVGLFTQAEACHYVQAKLSAHPALADDVAGLVADLGRLPLALAQAAAFIADDGRTCTEYRKLFADRRRKFSKLLPKPQHLPDGHQATVDVTWSLSVEAANREEPAGLASQVLTMASLLDPDGIPMSVLTSPPALAWLAQSDPAGAVLSAGAVRAACRSLHRYSLAIHDPTNPTRALRVHALVQRATYEHTNDNTLDACAVATADALDEAWPDIDRDAELAQALRNNTIALTAARNDALWTHTNGSHVVLFQAGHSLGNTGQVHAAIVHFTQLHEQARQRLGADHADTLATRYNIARWRGEAGDAAGAAAAFEQVLADRLRVLGTDHRDTLVTRSNLAFWRGEAGDAAGAAAAFEQVLTDQIRVLGPERRETLVARSRLAYWRGRAGDAAAAAAAFEQVLADCVRVLGADHRDTLVTRNNMASWRGEAGDAAEAAAAFEQVLADCLRVLGPSHPDTLIARSNLAHWRGRAGDAAGAAAAFEQLLADRLRVLGPDHPRTLTTRNSLKYWRRRTGEAGSTS